MRAGWRPDRAQGRYKGAKVGRQRVDFVQALSYLKPSGYQVALLFNFGARKLQIKRLANWVVSGC